MARKPLTDEQREKARARQRRYNAKPEVKAKAKVYYQRPEVRQRYIDRGATEAHREYAKQWRASEQGRAALKDGALRKSTEGAFNLELWKTLVDLQGGACAICRRPFDALGFRDVHADHCHDEQTPRGLLCRNCNHAEGQIRKTGLSPEEFGRRLMAYLGNPPAARAVAKTANRVQPEERSLK